MRARISCFSNNQLMSQMVERTPEILEDIADDCREESRERLQNAEIIAAFSGLRIILGLNEVWVGFEKHFAESFKVNDVLFGPFGLR